MAEHDDDRELEEYLRGRSPLSQRYREASREEPSAHTDDAILAAARRAVGSGPRATGIPRTWFKPVSIAAVLALGVGLVITVQREEQASLMIDRAPAMQYGDTSTTSAVEERDEYQSPLRSRAERELEGEVLLETGPAREFSPRPQAPPVPVQRSAMDAIERQPSAAELSRDMPVSADDAPASPSLEAAAAGTAAEQETRNKAPLRILRKESSANTAAGAPPVTGSAGLPEQQLAEIAELWQEGHRELARENLRAFMAEHPGYSDAVLMRLLPQELYREVRSSPAP